MVEIFKKISLYEILNNLFPGALFAYLLNEFTSYNLIVDNVILALVFYYFIGTIISRLGSLVVEKVLKKVKLIEFSDYSDYIDACKVDSKIDILSKKNNMFRTIISMLLLLLLLIGYEELEKAIPALANCQPVILTVLLLILFVFSYRKQTNYINKRVQKHKES